MLVQVAYLVAQRHTPWTVTSPPTDTHTRTLACRPYVNVTVYMLIRRKTRHPSTQIKLGDHKVLSPDWPHPPSRLIHRLSWTGGIDHNGGCLNVRSMPWWDCANMCAHVKLQRTAQSRSEKKGSSDRKWEVRKELGEVDFMTCCSALTRLLRIKIQRTEAGEQASTSCTPAYINGTIGKRRLRR